MTAFQVMKKRRSFYSYWALPLAADIRERPSTTPRQNRLRLGFLTKEHAVICNAIRKLAGLINNLNPRKRDDHVRWRHRDLCLLSAGPFREFLIRPWAYDSGPPFN